MNQLEPGAGGLPSASPSDAKANNPLRPRLGFQPRPPSPVQREAGDAVDSARALFDKLKEAETQTDAIVDEFKQLVALADTVTTQDVVKGCAGIVAAGVPAMSMATILADMPERQPELQAWVAQKYKDGLAAEQQVAGGLRQARHNLVVAGLQAVLAHSAEAHHQRRLLAAAQPMGNA